MKSKVINISLPQELVDKVDTMAKASYASRSDFIRESVVQRLKRDTSSDAAEWETLIDFRDIEPNGAAIDDVIRSLKEFSA